VTLTIPSDQPQRIEELERRLVPGLRPLAGLAYNYRWSWQSGGADLFAAIDPARWASLGENPVRFLAGLPRQPQVAAESDTGLLDRIRRLDDEVAGALREPAVPAPGLDGPIAFFCAEYGVHVSLPTYAGGLGVLAGDILKEASDRGVAMVALGLLYRRGYFCQRLDVSGWQQEYWLEHEPAELPLALVLGGDGGPLRLSVPLLGSEVAFQVWLAAVGRVPLLLLDTGLPENDAVARWTSGRLYEGNPEVRLAQYGLLGAGGARTLAALGIDPGVIHLNEGHPALAPLVLAAASAEGAGLDDALDAVRDRVVFTTHTPLAAGNETYPAKVFRRAFADLEAGLGAEAGYLARLAASADGGAGMSALAMRLSGRRNAVSRLHAATAREIWAPSFPDHAIDHVTNGAHLQTFLAEPLARLFDRHLDGRWRRFPADPSAWEGVYAIPNEELWAARCAARGRLVRFAAGKAVSDRLLRGEDLDYAKAAAGLDPDALTLGFARRLAAYKRLDLLVSDPARLGRILNGERPCQLLIAGKAHPRDEEGKRVLQRLYACRHEIAAGRLLFLEDYDLAVGRELVAGCDVWINLPRPPLEASGTSGMKAAFNGALQLSVLDGWWAEAFTGRNGWGIEGGAGADHAVADAADAERLYSILEEEAVPMYYDRDEHGVPHRWCELVKEAITSCAPRFTSTRMLQDYLDRIYVGRRAPVTRKTR
jgi:starch phosphorylase